MQLHDRDQQRLYINAPERERFLAAAAGMANAPRSFCLTLAYTGCRISEALALTPVCIQLETHVIAFRTLKRRKSNVMREVPIPTVLAEEVARIHAFSANPQSRTPLWRDEDRPVSRSRAYRWVKGVMAEAGIVGAQACPKGLRHGFGVHANASGVQLDMIRKWMGHASIKTTAIYTTAAGPEERRIADRMWRT